MAKKRLRKFWHHVLDVVDGVTGRKVPPRFMPKELVEAYTLGGKIPVLHKYFNNLNTGGLVWTPDSPEWDLDKVRRRETDYYSKTDTYLYEALDKYLIRDKEVVIVGSESPWYECICTSYGAKVTTIEYRTVDCSIPGLKVLKPDEFAKTPTRFDVVMSISSIEHDGLGRYGDPLNPTGDLKAMSEFKKLLKPGGLLFLAMPVGQDAVTWNSHRIYGRKRLPMLFDGWNVVARFGFDDSLFDNPLGHIADQPVFVLSH